MPRMCRPGTRMCVCSMLRLPEGDLAAGGGGDDAAPASWAFARLQQHTGPQFARTLGDPVDLGDLDVGKPERAPGLALHHSAPDPVAELEREVRSAAGVDSLRTPPAEPRVERAGAPQVPCVELQVDDGVGGGRAHALSSMTAVDGWINRWRLASPARV